MKAQKVWVLFLAMALVVFGFGAMAQAVDPTAEQTVTFEVQATNAISVSGSPTLTISTATAGSQPTDYTDSSTAKYNITTNETGKKITAKIDSNMPTGTTLKVNLTAPSTGTSAGAQELTETAIDVVTGIGQVAESNLPITYTFSATVSAGVVTSSTRTVTFTLTSTGGV